MRKFTAVVLCGILSFSCIAKSKLSLGTYEISEKGKQNAEFMKESAMFYYYIRQKKMKEAAELLQTILEKKPDSAYLLYWTTRLYSDGVFPEEKLIEIARRHPGSSLLCSSFAEVLAEKGKKTIALEIAENALAYYLDPPAEGDAPRGKKGGVMPHDFQLLMITWLTFMMQDKNYEEGDLWLIKADAIYPLQKVKDSTLLRLISYTYYADSDGKKKDLAEIRKRCSGELKKRLEGPNEFSQEVGGNFVLQLLQAREIKLVEALLTEGLLTDPYSQSVYRNLVLLYNGADQKFNVLRALSCEIYYDTLKKKRLPGHRLAFLVLQAIDADDASLIASQIKTVENLRHLNDDLCYKLCVYYLEKGDTLNAKKYISKTRAPVLKKMLTAFALQQEKKYQQALHLFLELERAFPKEAMYKMLAADTARKAGDREIERQFLNEMLMKSKGNPEFQNFIGYTWADQGIHLDQAENLIAEALKHSPESYAYLDSMAWVAHKKGDHQRAKRYILKALVRCTGKSSKGVLLDHAGDIFAALRDRRRAMYYWQQAVQSGDTELDMKSVLQKLPRPTAKEITKVQSPESKASDQKTVPAAPETKPSLQKTNKE